MKNEKNMHTSKLFRHGQYERSGSDFWLTPNHIIEELIKKYGDLFDPCPRLPDFDGLEIEWPRDQWIYVNPPYSNIETWAKKCFVEWKKGSKIIMLIPARTDTRYFHTWIHPHAKIEFIKGRLKYLNPITKETKGSAPFPSIFCIYNGNEGEGGSE
jgi:site-specific DNA-methyltransferase (adenine-specific)